MIDTTKHPTTSTATAPQANPRLCLAHFIATHDWEPDMGDDESLYEPGTCDECGAEQIVFWLDL